MRIIKFSSKNPYLNLASEYHLLKQTKEDLFIVWKNKNTIVVGRNQNTYDEVNQIYVRDKKIKVVRRITGGGAVFHDDGNINYSIIIKKQKDIKKQIINILSVIIEFLKSLGLNGYFSGRNDILINEKKVSGIASCIHKDKLLIHGTLLFDANLDDLFNSLNVNKLKVISKGIASIKSRVGNINDFLKNKISVKKFEKLLIDFLISKYKENLIVYNQKKAIIFKLIKSQFENPKWIWAKNFDFNFQNNLKNDFGLFNCKMQITENRIDFIKIYSDTLETIDFMLLEKSLIKQNYEIKNIEKILLKNKIKYQSINNNEIIYLLFNNK